jgi:CHAT domain-containing protein
MWSIQPLARVALCFLFGVTLALVGSPLERWGTPSNLTVFDPASMRTLRAKANALLAGGSFAAALGLYEQGRREAMDAGKWQAQLRFLNNMGAANLALYRYRAAQQAWLEARQVAQEHGDTEMLSAVWVNLSSLYLQVEDTASAWHAAEQALRLLNAGACPGFRPRLLAQSGAVKAEIGDRPEALKYFRRAIEAAETMRDDAFVGVLLDRMGLLDMKAGNFEEAEAYLMEAFRRRKLAKDPDVRASYGYLGRLRLAQRDYRSAAALFRAARAVSAASPDSPVWKFDYYQASAEFGLGHAAEGLRLLRKALASAREWRVDAAPSDPSQISADIGLHQLYQAYVDALLEQPRPRAEKAFLAAEEDRAAGLRRSLLMARLSRERIPPAYWERLAQLRQAQAALAANETPQTRRAVARRRFEFNEIETKSRIYSSISAGYKTEEKSSIQRTLISFRQVIRPSEALLSFYRGQRTTYRWTVNREGIEYQKLSSREELTGMAAAFQNATKMRSAQRDKLSGELYSTLFKGVSEAVLSKSRWLITADDAIFGIPFAALRTGEKYLLEEREIQRIPSAYMLGAVSGRRGAALFVGIGDGVYNSADPRGKTWARRAGNLQLARLAASGRELETCARQWGRGANAVLLTGPRASRQQLESALENHAAVLHIAAHILHPGDEPARALIDLGLTAAGEAEVLTGEDIGSLRAPGALVVMSGCNSAAGGSVPGAGILGLTRAWMLAGADTVVGSFWPTPDDTGELFGEFYRELRSRFGWDTSGRAVAAALRQAQLTMLRSTSWRSNPAYWGAFYVVGKE